MLLRELFDTSPTIATAKRANGEIDRAKADGILDPRGYFRKNRRAMHETFDPASLAPTRLAELRRQGFDTQELLYHGTNADFATFDATRLRTAAHFYTTPDPRTAAYYGKTVYVCIGRQDPQADLIGESTESAQLLHRVVSTFAPDHTDAVADSLSDLKQQIAARLLSAHAGADQDYDELLAEWDAEETDEYKTALLRAAETYLYDRITSGGPEMYGLSSAFQNGVMRECFGLGYRSVRFYDYNTQGTPLSVVFKDAADIAIIGRLGADEAEEQFYTHHAKD